LKQPRSELDSFKATRLPKSEINVGVSGVVGHEVAMAVQSVQRSWYFPGDPHRVIRRCHSRHFGERQRSPIQPHPGVLVLDSPLLS